MPDRGVFAYDILLSDTLDKEELMTEQGMEGLPQDGVQPEASQQYVGTQQTQACAQPPYGAYNGGAPEPPYASRVGAAPQPAAGPGPQYYASNGAQPAAAAAPKKSHGWIVAIVVIAAIFLFAVISVASCSSMISSIATSSVGNEVQPKANTVAVITLEGTIQYDGTSCSPEGLKTLLDRAAADENVIAVVLRVNSGGGTATAGEEMATYVRQFRESTGKPVVVSSASINASAAYEISSQADYIYTAKTTEIGAIGTIMSTYDLSELMEKLGISVNLIASADSKDSSYGYRPLTDEERAYYQNMVNEINATFIENVAQGRSMTISQVEELATGLPFAGTTAVKNGIADEIGTLEDAVERAAHLAGASTYETYNLTLRTYDISSLTYLLSKNDVTLDQLSELLKENESHGIVAQ